MNFFERRFHWFVGIFCLILLIQMWLCSGTLAPYAATLINPNLVDENGELISIQGDTDLHTIGCYYIANYDHKHYVANYALMDGQPRDNWNWGYVLRRPLLFILSYPLMKVFGFTSGGFAMAMALNVLAMAFFALWVRRKWGAASAVLSMVILASFPPTMYWSGEPYAQILITPGTLMLTMLLCAVYETQSIRKIAIYSLIGGILFLAYDLYNYFLPAFLLLLVFQKKWKAIPLSLLFLVLPFAGWLFFLSGKLSPHASENSDTYMIVLKAYTNLNWPDLWRHIKDLPNNLYVNLLGATYIYLSAFLAMVTCANLLLKRFRMPLPVIAIGVPILIVFLFNNLAPYYDGWQMREDNVARIYQPVFILCLLPAFYLLRELQVRQKQVLANGVMLAGLIVFAFNTRINIAPAFGDDSQAYHHYRFYKHSPEEVFHANLQKFGRRPMWVCF